MSNLRDHLVKAKNEGYALGAFNIDSLEVFQAVVQAAAEKKCPVLAEVSPGEQKALGLQNVVAIKNNLVEEYGVELFLNLDHANDLDLILNAIELGFDLVHFDGSELPFDENLRLASEIVLAAHKSDVLVEGEIDHFPGSSEPGLSSANSKASTADYTDPEMARKFVEETGVDILAAFIGNKHGMYSDGSENLDVERLKQIKMVLPETFFSLHGGSGIPADQVRAAIGQGIVKVNVNTELRVAFRETLENMLKGNPEEFAWYKLTAPVLENVKMVVEKKIDIFSGRT